MSSTEDKNSARASSPRIFINHDARDADLAEAFATLLRRVSSGIFKTFRSSDKTGKEGIAFGDEWYKVVMDKLELTSYIVCLFTERSLERPWILFEAGGAKGKMATAIGVALGVPLDRVETGPFSQFQNMDDSEEDLTKLIKQIASPAGLEPDDGVVKEQVTKFKKTEEEILKKLGAPPKYTSDFLYPVIDFLRPSIQVYPPWPNDQQPNWQPDNIPQGLCLERSEVETDPTSALLLGFRRKLGRMNIVNFCKRLDIDPSAAWIGSLLESLHAALKGQITDQSFIYFRSVIGSILRPIIDFVTRSEDGRECKCRVVFVDAFTVPAVANPSSLQILASSLRMAVRTRIEILDRYKGKMNKERLLMDSIDDRAEEVQKLHPVGSLVMETLRVLKLEGEMQIGSIASSPAPLLFDQHDQSQYQDIRRRFAMVYSELKINTQAEDNEPGSSYSRSEKNLEELDQLNKEYIVMAAPRFLTLLNSHLGSDRSKRGNEDDGNLDEQG